MTSKTVSVRLDQDTLERLGVLATVMNRPKAWLMAHAIRRYVEDQAWQVEAIQQAVQRQEHGEAKFAEHEQVMAWLESWGADSEQEPPACG
ncbi:MAG: CopG family ribbon-helix-helix protein [Candidatus Competibacteraceae bacterium]